MKRIVGGVSAALLVVALAGAPASAGGRSYGYVYGPHCNCDGPVVQVVPAGTQVITTHRTIHTNQVIPHVRVRERNRVIVHQRTVVHRHIVTHRHNTEHRYITINRINTAHKFRTVHKRQVVHRRVNTTSHTYRTRTVKGRSAPGPRNDRGLVYHLRQIAIGARN